MTFTQRSEPAEAAEEWWHGDERETGEKERRTSDGATDVFSFSENMFSCSSSDCAHAVRVSGDYLSSYARPRDPPIAHPPLSPYGQYCLIVSPASRSFHSLDSTFPIHQVKVMMHSFLLHLHSYYFLSA